MAPPKDESKATESVPKPELSPTSNPILAQNLGLWAKVYYTTPPEQREQAVQELLRELKGETNTEITGQASAGSAGPAAEGRNLSADVHEENLVCPACFHTNQAEQRWCGLCGYPLPFQAKAPAEKPLNKTGIAVPAAAPAPPSPPPKPIERGDESWDWLREKNAAAFETSSEKSGSWKYAALAAMGVLVVAIGLVWWARSTAPKPHGSAPSSATPVEKPAETPSPAQVTGSAHASPGQSSAQPWAAPKPNENPGPSPPWSHTDASSPRPANPDAKITPGDDGEQELQQAKRFLDGRELPRDSRAASHLLWKSVAKKNPQAVLLLSDLYVRGDGVAQSCDQARVLLSTAAQKGSAAAQVKLDEIKQSSCR